MSRRPIITWCPPSGRLKEKLNPRMINIRKVQLKEAPIVLRSPQEVIPRNSPTSTTWIVIQALWGRKVGISTFSGDMPLLGATVFIHPFVCIHDRKIQPTAKQCMIWICPHPLLQPVPRIQQSKPIFYRKVTLQISHTTTVNHQTSIKC
ncbi:unnamed protein product [Aspergillus oryzae var. brunneus]|uniref:Unnamed protein product n=2 Tax=Aspergillus oryzae TaxID=5062 RepID=A0AAN4YUG0_ASPOZ|nr:unnamed protein product [Aspergillus oryzae]GMG34282.1 unnamed protein product [Aspergillus oryzae]GMG45563.1 unnamed protein product [Aspergillus oryzae var. brunneus]